MSKEEAVVTPAAGITPEEARRILEAEQARNLRACEAEIGMVLQKHGCQLVAVRRLTEDGRVLADVRLRAVS